MDDQTALMLAFLDREIAAANAVEPATEWADGYAMGLQRGLRHARAFLGGLASVPFPPEERTAEQAAAIARAAERLP